MHLVRLANHLDRACFHVAIALSKPGGIYEPALEADIERWYLKSGASRSSTARALGSILPLRGLVQKTQPEIVCAVMERANLAALAAVWGVSPRPKMIVCVQNTPSIVYGRSKKLVDRLILALLPKAYPAADQVVALSHGVAEDLLALAPRLARNLRVIHNAGLDRRVLRLASQPVAQEVGLKRPLILACGRLTEQKGFSSLLRALVEVRKDLPAQLWIIGEGPQRPFLEQEIRALGLQACVHLPGFLENPYGFMAAADVFVLPSLWEGFGNVIVEAMACGAPVIASDCPHGPAEIITDRVDGLLVPPGQAGPLAQALLLLLKDAALSRSLRENGFQRALDFEATAIAARYAALFTGLL